MQHGSLAYYDSNIFYISPVSIHKRSIEVVHDSELLFFIVLITLSSVIHFLYRKGGITMQYSTSFKQQILSQCRNGVSVSVVAKSNNVSRSTIYRWLSEASTVEAVEQAYYAKHSVSRQGSD